MRQLIGMYVLALLIAGGITLAITGIPTENGVWTALMAGWGLAAAGALLGTGMKAIGLRGDFGWFMIWALGMNGIRVLFFVAIMVVAYRSDVAHFRPFLKASLAGYFCCLYGEVVLLHRISLRNWSSE